MKTALSLPLPSPWLQRLSTRLGGVVARRSALVLPLALVVALLVLLINEISYRHSSEALMRLEQRARATLRMQTVMRRLLDAESGQRGYLLTGRAAYLDPYRQAAADTYDGLSWLHAYYADEPVSSADIEAMQAHAKAKFELLAEMVSAYDAGSVERWNSLLNSEDGLRHMTALRELSAQVMERERQHVLAERKAVFGTLATSRIGVNITAAVGVLLLLLVLRQARVLEIIGQRHTRALQAEGERLETEVQQRTSDLSELARHLQTVREDEKSRLARDLHDELGALLTTTKLDLARLRHTLAGSGKGTPEVIARLDHLTAGIDSGIALKRRIIEDLRPSSLSNLGLVSALQIQLREFGERAGLQIHTRLQPLELSDAAQITVYRLVQEALTNIAKYAQAQQVEVSLEADPDGSHARLRVKDDGRGFEPSAPRRSAHGLMGMNYRVQAVGGSLDVHSAPGQGTCIEARLPLLKA